MGVFNSLLKLFYPELCSGCGQSLLRGEKTICLSCMLKIARTDYHTFSDNPVAKLFYGKINIKRTTMCFYDKGGLMQHLLHQLKYRNNFNVGLFLGKQLGKCLSEAELYKDIDVIIPIPLHKKKLKKEATIKVKSLQTALFKHFLFQFMKMF